MAEQTLKICVVGPPKIGKTLLCRVLAEQPLFANEYHPTAGVRIQEISRTVGVDRVKIQLWDCSGNSQYQGFWNVLAKDLDGILLVLDSSKPEQEKDLEQFYMSFAQPNDLTTKQCMVMAVQVVKEGTYGGLSGWSGLQGKMSKLQQGFATINPAAPNSGAVDANGLLDRLLTGCLQQKKDTLERAVVGD